MEAINNVTRRGARKPQSAPAKAQGQRASQVQPISIDASAATLRNLMTEQCKIPTGFATFYEGTASQFGAAGFPVEAIPSDDVDRPLQIDPGGHAYESQVEAWFRRKGAVVELEIHWGMDGPGGCGHPALTEIARMTLVDLSFWTESYGLNSIGEVPTDRLLACGRATDYSLSPDKRFRFTPDFYRALQNMKSMAYTMIRRGEVIPIEPAAQQEESPAGGNVVRLSPRSKAPKSRPL